MKIIKDNKVILILVWPSWAWKSTFIEENNLKGFCISLDTIRMLLWGVELTEKTSFWEWITQKYNKKVVEIYYQILEEKMKNGLFIVCDNTHLHKDSFKEYRKLAKDYWYEVFYKEFLEDFDTLLKRNQSRGYKMLPESALFQQFDKVSKFIQPEEITKISRIEELPNYIPYDSELTAIENLGYERIYFIWDIQGCYTPLYQFLAEEYSENSLYVFTWDFIDRGPDNWWVVELLWELVQRDNCVFIKWNHDNYLIQHAFNGRQPVGRKEFDSKTMQQLSWFQTQNLQDIASCFCNAFICNFNGNIIFASHGGINKLTHFIPDSQLIRWVWDYENHQQVDEFFNEWSEQQSKNFISIHWHRNSDDVWILSTDRTYNLEWGVEFEWFLRAVKFSCDGTVEHLYYKQ